MLIPKGTKVFIGKGDGATSVDGRQIYINQAKNPTKKITKKNEKGVDTSIVSAANDTYYNKVYLDCKDSAIWAAAKVGYKLDDGPNNGFYQLGNYLNETLTEILVTVFCKGKKIKTWEELTVTDNVNKTT